jgi:hypothetical protein
MILSLLSMESALAQSGAGRDPRLGRLCGTPNQQPCLPDLIDASIQKSPTVFNLQVRVSPTKIPSGRGVVSMFVNLSNREGDVLCSESFSNPVKIRNGVLNLEIGRGMDCALDEVLMENEVIRIQLCIGSEESCLRPIELTAVPFALSAHYATEAKKARTATVAARTDVTHRATADTDILKPSAVGYGYFDFFSPSDEQLAPLGLGSSLDGSLLWTPVRGHEEGEEFSANQVLFVGEDTHGEIAMLRAIHLLAVDTTIKGRARVLNGHVDILEM